MECRKGFGVPLVILLLIIILSATLLLLFFKFKPARLNLAETNRNIDAKLSNEQKNQAVNNLSTTEQDTKIIGDFQITIKDNTTDKSKADIYLKDKQTDKETYFTTLTDIYKNHYHNSEYSNGFVYIIHRTGGDSGYQNNPNWTDELWKYNKQKQGTKLYSNRGLDFRVSNDGVFIAIIGSGSNNVVGENLTILNNKGSVLKTFTPKDIGIENFQPVEWSSHNFWFSDSFGPMLQHLVKLNVDDLKFKAFKLSTAIGPEYDLNPTTEKVVFSDYPAMFDVDSANEYEQSGKKVTLSIYDLATNKQEQIATSITKMFKPIWIDENTVEYENPSGMGRVTKKII